jgi:hypothetical protein
VILFANSIWYNKIKEAIFLNNNIQLSFTEFMLSAIFENFNNKDLYDLPLNDEIRSWSNLRLANAISKLTRELMRRDEHGLKESPFIEKTDELHKLLYLLTMYMEYRLSKEPS